MAITASGIRAASAFVEVGLRTLPFDRGLRQLENKLRRFGSDLSLLGSKIATAGVISLVPVGLGVREFGEFDNQVQSVRAIAAQGAASIAHLTSRFKELGRTTSFTATQIATAAKDLAKGGFNTDLIDASLEGVLNLSRATETDLPRSAEIVSKLLNSFNIPKNSKDITKFIDQLVLTTNRSPQGLEDLFESLKNFAPQGKALGQSTESLLAFNAALARVGLTGTLSGTQIRRIFVNLANPEKKLKLGQLGVDVDKIFNNGGNALDVLKELNTVFQALDYGSLTESGILNEIFEVRGQLAAKVFLSDLGKVVNGASNELEGFMDELRRVDGFAARAAKGIDSGLGNQFKILISAISGVGLELGESLKKPLTKIIGFISENLNYVSEWITANKDLVRTYTAIAAAVTLTGAAMFILGNIAFTAAAGVGAIALAGVLAVSPIIMLAKAFGAAVGVLGIAASSINSIGTQIGKLFKALNVGAAIGLLTKGVSKIFSVMGSGAVLLGKGLLSAAKGLFVMGKIGTSAAIKSIPKVLWEVSKLAFRLGSAFLLGGQFLMNIQLIAEGYNLVHAAAVALFKVLKGGLGSIVSLHKGVFRSITAGFQNVAYAASNTLLIVQRTTKAIIFEFRALAYSLQHRFQGVGKSISKVLSITQKRIAANRYIKPERLLDELILGFHRSIKVLKVGLRSAFTDVGHSIKGIFSSVIRGFGGVARQVFRGALSMATPLVKGLGLALRVLIPTIQVTGTVLRGAWIGFVATLKAIPGALAFIGSALRSFIVWELVIRGITLAFESIDAIIRDFTTSFKGFGSEATKVGGAIHKAFDAGLYREVFNLMWAAAKSFFTRVKEAVKVLAVRFTNFLMDLKDQFTSTFDVLVELSAPFFAYFDRSYSLDVDYSDALKSTNDYFDTLGGKIAAAMVAVGQLGARLALEMDSVGNFLMHGVKKMDAADATEEARKRMNLGLENKDLKEYQKVTNDILSGTRNQLETEGFDSVNLNPIRELYNQIMGQDLDLDEFIDTFKLSGENAADQLRGLTLLLHNNATQFVEEQLKQAGERFVGKSFVAVKRDRMKKTAFQDTLDDIEKPMLEAEKQFRENQKARRKRLDDALKGQNDAVKAEGENVDKAIRQAGFAEQLKMLGKAGEALSYILPSAVGKLASKASDLVNQAKKAFAKTGSGSVAARASGVAKTAVSFINEAAKNVLHDQKKRRATLTKSGNISESSLGLYDFKIDYSKPRSAKWQESGLAEDIAFNEMSAAERKYDFATGEDKVAAKKEYDAARRVFHLAAAESKREDRKIVSRDKKGQAILSEDSDFFRDKDGKIKLKPADVFNIDKDNRLVLDDAKNKEFLERLKKAAKPIIAAPAAVNPAIAASIKKFSEDTLVSASGFNATALQASSRGGIVQSLQQKIADAVATTASNTTHTNARLDAMSRQLGIA